VVLLDDRAAYSSLVRRHQVAIRTYLTRLTHNLEIADELAQETFLSGYRRITQLQDLDKFLPWIYSIAHTQFLQWLRTQKKNVPEERRTVEASVGTEIVTAGIELESILKPMRPEERSALILCLGHEFSHAEAADILKIPIGTVKSLISRAKAKLGAVYG